MFQQQHHTEQKPVTFYLDEELNVLKREEPELKRYVSNMDISYLTPTILTPLSAPLSPNEPIKIKILDEEEPVVIKTNEVRKKNN